MRTITDSEGDTSFYTYDADNRVSVVEDPEVRMTKSVYNARGEVVQAIRAFGTPLQQVYKEVQYTANGQTEWVKDANGNKTSYGYDGFGRLLVTTFPDGNPNLGAGQDFETYSYDAAGNVVARRTRRGDVISYTYDALNRMTAKTVPGAPGGGAFSFAYDLTGRQVQAVHEGLTEGFVYDSLGRLVEERQNGALLASHAYDAAGNRTRLTWADGYFVDYGYDALNRMVTAAENGATTLATFTYDVLSRTRTLTYGNGASVSFDYEPDSDLKSIVHSFTSGGAPLAGGGTGAAFTHQYTRAGQLRETAANDNAFLFTPPLTQGISYAVNSLNQYTTVTTDTVPATPSYDNNGNLTGDGQGAAYTFDAENRLTAATVGATAVTYRSYANGARRSKDVGGTVTQYLVSADHVIAEYDGPDDLASANILRRYVHGPGTDRPIAMVEGDATSGYSHSYYHADRLGSVVALTDDSGAPVTHYTYDGYGIPWLVDPATGAQTQVAAGQPYLFTGRSFDFETGLYYYRARYYSASLGRFLQTDPVGYEDQMNLYAYVGNDPVNGWDPDGRYQRGDGWSDPEWEQFNKVQKQVAADMREAASNLKADAVESQKMGDSDTAAGLLEERGWLLRGAAILENDGKDAKKAHIEAFNYGDKDKTPKPQPFGEVHPETKDVTFNRSHDDIKMRHNWTTTGFKFGVGHESIHSAGLMGHAEVRFPAPYGLTTAYRYGIGKQKEAYERIPMGSSQARENPDHIMSRVYP